MYYRFIVTVLNQFTNDQSFYKLHWATVLRPIFIYLKLWKITVIVLQVT